MAKRPSDKNTAEKYDKTNEWQNDRVTKILLRSMTKQMNGKRPSDKNTAEKYDKTNEWQNDRVTKILLRSMTKQMNGKTTE